MYHPLDRRNFLKAGAVLGAGIGLSGLGGIAAAAEKPAGRARTPKSSAGDWDARPGRSISYTFFEAIDKTAGLGLHYIEAFPGQKVSRKSRPGSVMDCRPSNARRSSKAGRFGREAGELRRYVGIDGRKTFDFAKDMGIETIVSEPGEERFPEIGQALRRVRDQYRHSRPSQAFALLVSGHVLKVTKGLSKRIGACCDTGHWPRSGLNAVECLKKLRGADHQFPLQGLE